MSMGKLTTRRAPSISALTEIKDVTEETAALVRGAWRSFNARRNARDAINTLIETHGVEYLGVHRRTGLPVYYCNAGDTYATTLIFHGENMTVGDWGSLVEKNLIRS